MTHLFLVYVHVCVREFSVIMVSITLINSRFHKQLCGTCGGRAPKELDKNARVSRCGFENKGDIIYVGFDSLCGDKMELNGTMDGLQTQHLPTHFEPSANMQCLSYSYANKYWHVPFCHLLLKPAINWADYQLDSTSQSFTSGTLFSIGDMAEWG